jgi:hypothetical protein
MVYLLTCSNRQNGTPHGPALEDGLDLSEVSIVWIMKYLSAVENFTVNGITGWNPAPHLVQKRGKRGKHDGKGVNYGK